MKNRVCKDKYFMRNGEQFSLFDITYLEIIQKGETKVEHYCFEL